MKKLSLGNLIIGIILGASLFGGSTAIASSITATVSDWKIHVDGQPAGFDAYSIAGSNWLELRDVCQAVDVGVWFDADKREVYIERDKKYDANYTGPGQSTAIQSGTTIVSRHTWEITISSIEVVDKIERKSGMFTYTTKAGDGNKIVMVNASVKNIGTSNNNYWVSNLVYEGNILYNALNTTHSDDISRETIGPLITKTGFFAFRIPNEVANSRKPLVFRFMNDAEYTFTLPE